MSEILSRPWLLHPAVVHFPIALLLTGLLLAGLAVFWREELHGHARWLLYLGTLAAWAAFGLGLIAEDTVPHVPAAWQVLRDHKLAAYWLVGAFSLISAVRFWLDRTPRRRGRELAFLLLWLWGAAIVLRTGYLGGELPYTFNVGTKASQE